MSAVSEKRPIRIGMFGKGTVGTPVARELQLNGREHGLELKRVFVRDPDRHLASPDNTLNPHQFTDEAIQILADPDIDIVVELMGGMHPARDIISNAIMNRKSVVTANKAVLAEQGRTLFDAARGRVDVGFEAAVGGKIPIMSLLRHFDGEPISQILGILNGTSNFIMTRMLEDGMSYEDAVKLAKEKGFAERDESRDVKGEDAADKITLLASLAWNTQIDRSKIKPTGIDGVTLQDMRMAERLGPRGYTIKPLVLARVSDGGGELELNVSPALIRRENPLAGVRNERNGLMLDTQLGSSVTIEGPGAGGEATASAVLADIRRVARNLRRGVVDDLPTLDSGVRLTDSGDSFSRWYMRVNFGDREGIFEEYGRILRENHLSAQHSIQEEDAEGQGHLPDYDTLKLGRRRDVEQAVSALRQTDMVEGVPYVLPIWQS